VRDAALIGGAQKVEHYEIASYGTIAALAKQLGYKDALPLLLETLEEEGHRREAHPAGQGRRQQKAAWPPDRLRHSRHGRRPQGWVQHLIVRAEERARRVVPM
jgi:hypothetical protein